MTALESRVEEVAADATAARHLAAARDRDIADLGVKVDANRAAINALGVQTAERFDRLEHDMHGRFAMVDERFAQVDARFAQIDDQFVALRGTLDQFAGAQQHIVDLLTTLIDDR